MVLEEAVAEVLQKTLGAYLEGVDADNLNLSVWSGDVRLRSVRLRTEALAALPVCVLRGTVGEVRVEVPVVKYLTKEVRRNFAVEPDSLLPPPAAAYPVSCPGPEMRVR